MSSVNQDLRKILHSYVNRQSQDEVEFIDQQYHLDSGDKDVLVIESNLSNTKISSESIENQEKELIKSDISPSIVSNSDYLVDLFHTTKSSSLNESRMREFQMVGKNASEQSGSLLPKSQRVPILSKTLPGKIHKGILLPNSDKENIRSSKKTNKTKVWKPNFSWYKKSEKERIVVGSEVAEMKVQARTVGSPMSFNRDVPFKSHRIQPMKKKKKMPNFLWNMLSPSHSMPKCPLGQQKRHCWNDENCVHLARKSVESQDEGVISSLSRDYERDDPSCEAGEKDCEFLVTKRLRSKSEKIPDVAADEFISDLAEPRRKSYPDKPCNCDKLRFDLMANVIKGKALQNSMKELDELDKGTFHFTKCPYNADRVSGCKDSMGSSRQSQASLYQSNEHCDNVDDQLLPELSSQILPFLNKLEDGDEINFNDDHLRFFLEATSYEQFEEGMRQAIGFKCSVRNLAYLHYVIRKVVRHIGDPGKGDNTHIKRIMHFAERFCKNHFSSHIEEHGSVEEFLKHCRHHELD